jgi:AraC family transcriptional regulator
MDIQIVGVDPFRVAMLRHSGSYAEISPVFDTLWKWVEAENISVQRTLGLYWDNPDFVPVSQLRSAACVEVSSSTQIRDTLSLGLEEFTVPGGSYATTRYVGRYDELTPVWSRFTKLVEKKAKGIPDSPAYEVYVNDPSEVSPDELITELYMPVQ